jgi:hypothetical protein
MTLTADEKLAAICVKVKWAKKHFDDLKIARQRFIDVDPKPYAFSVNENLETGEVKLQVIQIAEPPAEIGLLTGDVVHNLRSALDHLAYQLVFVGTKGNGPFRNTYFPISDTAKKYETFKRGKVKGMSKRAKEAIDRAQPYNRGIGHLLWVLDKLDIADKHHALIRSDLRVKEATLTRSDPFVSGSLSYSQLVSFGKFSLPKFREPLKAGDVFFTFNRNDYDDVQPAFDITFRKPEVLQGQSVLVTLEYMIQLVNDLILSFRDKLA